MVYILTNRANAPAWVLLFCCAMLLSGCKDKRPHTVSFYYWKTHFQLDATEKMWFASFHPTALYVRYFDLDDTEGQIHPVQPIVFDSLPPRGTEMIPVVFIRNHIFKQKPDLVDLGNKIVDFVQQINQHYQLTCKQLQLDCDWTPSTRADYFKLIKQVKKQTGWQVSATIRLHQFKYTEAAGVPDIDYGVLMYYNMGEIGINTANSIYSRDEALSYIKSTPVYPKPLSLALPLFHWYVHSRNHTVINLLTGLSGDSLSAPAFSHPGASEWVAQQDVWLQSFHFQKGDMLKLESVTPADLRHMMSDLEENHLFFENILFFDLNSPHLQQYNPDEIKKAIAYP